MQYYQLCVYGVIFLSYNTTRRNTTPLKPIPLFCSHGRFHKLEAQKATGQDNSLPFSNRKTTNQITIS